MNPDQPSACRARAPFKAVQGKHGVKFRQAPPPRQTGPVLELEHTGHDHVVLDVRERYRLASGRIGSRHQVLLALNSHEAAELGGLLFHFVDRHLRNDAEAPFHHIVTTPERAACGLWANRSGDAFAVAKAEQALYQMAMVPDAVGN